MTHREALYEALRREGVSEEEIKTRACYADLNAPTSGYEEIDPDKLEAFIETARQHWRFSQTLIGQALIQAQLKEITQRISKENSLN